MPCWLLEGTRIRLGSCVKQGRKLEREWGVWGESRKYESIFFGIRTPFSTLCHATRRTFYYPYATLRSLSYKIKDYRQACLVSPTLATTQVSVYMAKKRPTKQTKAIKDFVVGFSRAALEKCYM